jgi:maleylpyruvate isomerase
MADADHLPEHMAQHVVDQASADLATTRLLDAVRVMDAASVATPSRLPGWTRGHVLTHLARNADALANLLQGLPMYRSEEARDADIAAGAGRPPAELLADLEESAGRLRDAFAAEDDWERAVVVRGGTSLPVARLPFRRWSEVELHRVDLGAVEPGARYELEDLPEAFTLRMIDDLAARFAGHPGLPSLGLVAGPAAVDGRTWTTGGGSADSGGTVAVRGAAPDLLGWLSGRRDGSALTAEGGPLPVLPPL